MDVQAGGEGRFGATVRGFDPATASDDDFAALKNSVYEHKIVILKGQSLAPAEFVEMGRRMGRVEAYYEPMYHHPDEPDIFVSSNVSDGDKKVGVPKTGKFWHADYQFMPKPFGLTLIYPQVIPAKNRGTYYIDMTEAAQRLSEGLKQSLSGTRSLFSVRRYFKIRPSDVYRPLGEVNEEVERKTPTIAHPTFFRHPVTGATVLYNSEGFTVGIEDADGKSLDDGILHQVLKETGQLDMTFQAPGIHLVSPEQGDLLVWDNRALIHRALHTTTPEPTVSYRVTVHDEFPFHDDKPL
ncbi:(3R)-3-[(carboxymethyl)amino]fatty acid oxygenase/decarboxylase [Mangrovihabitans endophyticus]|uniref:Putative dioxygenase n=1 Tax=Mangrovihabitans endophyticus TaxID=1751298 RepID=A0A8J3BY05_9ACTN|nr:TauD/TfdA family dioxygenase [Mangrovihabitans endophyticus]GGK86746.1 putative dioxygenase [Mangrovihabitans endophyticus]